MVLNRSTPPFERHGAGAMTTWRRGFIRPPPWVPRFPNSSSLAMARRSTDACTQVWYFASPFRPRAPSPPGTRQALILRPDCAGIAHGLGQKRCQAPTLALHCCYTTADRVHFILSNTRGRYLPLEGRALALLRRARLLAQERWSPLPGARPAPSTPSQSCRRPSAGRVQPCRCHLLSALRRIGTFSSD